MDVVRGRPRLPVCRPSHLSTSAAHRLPTLLLRLLLLLLRLLLVQLLLLLLLVVVPLLVASATAADGLPCQGRGGGGGAAGWSGRGEDVRGGSRSASGRGLGGGGALCPPGRRLPPQHQWSMQDAEPRVFGIAGDSAG